MVQLFLGDAVDAGITFRDIDDFIASVPENDPDIELLIKCRGGDCAEGWAMYDKLRATGKTITATIEGECASMATILLLAAPRERRRAREHATLLIHNPYTAGAWGELNADRLQELSDELREEQNRILDLYVERTGSDRDTLQEVMNEGKFFGVDKALELGFISEVVAPLSAKAKANENINTKTTNKMNFIQKIKALITEAEAESAPVVGMELNTADGSTLTIEREEGEPQVGDAASPDGEWLMPDGSTIVVENGAITEIRPAVQEGAEAEPAEEPAEETEEAHAEAADEVSEDEYNAVVSERDALKTENEELKERIAELEAENADAKAKAKSADDMRVLNAIKIAGGADKVLAQFKSNGAETQRVVRGENAEEKSLCLRALEAKKK